MPKFAAYSSVSTVSPQGKCTTRVREVIGRIKSCRIRDSPRRLSRTVATWFNTDLTILSSSAQNFKYSLSRSS